VRRSIVLPIYAQGLVPRWESSPLSYRVDGSGRRPQLVDGRAGFGALSSRVVAADGRVVAAHLRAQGPHRALALRPDAEGVEVIETHGVLMRNRIDLVVGHVELLASVDEFLRCPGPFGVGVWKVELPTDVLHPNVVSVLDADGIGDKAGNEVLLENLTWF
jgi:hypothetical protein